MKPYIYQIIHILNRKPRHLDEHIKTLNRWSQTLFNRACVVDNRILSERIVDIVTKHGCDSHLSAFVSIKLSAEGIITLSLQGISLYEGYALRSIFPSAITHKYYSEALDAPTSAREATTAFALVQAQNQGAACVIEHDADNIITSANNSPLFAIKGDVVYTPLASDSVERMVAINAIKRAGMRLLIQDISVEQLPLFDELFLFNHMGITSISRCNGVPYTSIVVERIVRSLE